MTSKSNSEIDPDLSQVSKLDKILISAKLIELLKNPKHWEFDDNKKGIYLHAKHSSTKVVIVCDDKDNIAYLYGPELRFDEPTGELLYKKVIACKNNYYPKLLGNYCAENIGIPAKITENLGKGKYVIAEQVLNDQRSGYIDKEFSSFWDVFEIDGNEHLAIGTGVYIYKKSLTHNDWVFKA